MSKVSNVQTHIDSDFFARLTKAHDERYQDYRDLNPTNWAGILLCWVRGASAAATARECTPMSEDDVRAVFQKMDSDEVLATFQLKELRPPATSPGEHEEFRSQYLDLDHLDRKIMSAYISGTLAVPHSQVAEVIGVSERALSWFVWFEHDQELSDMNEQVTEARVRGMVDQTRLFADAMEYDPASGDSMPQINEAAEEMVESYRISDWYQDPSEGVGLMRGS